MCIVMFVCRTCFHSAEAFLSLVQDTGRLDVLALLLPGRDTLALSRPPASQLAERAEAAAQ